MGMQTAAADTFVLIQGHYFAKMQREEKMFLLSSQSVTMLLIFSFTQNSPLPLNWSKLDETNK